MAMHAEWWPGAGATSASGVAPLGARKSRSSVWRHSARDAWLVGVTLLQGAFTLAAFALAASFRLSGSLVAILAFGVGICWCSNAVSHNHLHNPLFFSRRANRVFDLWLTLLLGVPQSLWKARHIWHHAGEPATGPRPSRRLMRQEVALVALSWTCFLIFAPKLFVSAYLPGYLLGMGLCRLQGDMEHVRGEARGISYYGRIYNFFWFNDGHHAEHHQWPREHWSRLPARRGELTLPTSGLPPHLRFSGLVPSRGELKGFVLAALERLALLSTSVRRFVLAAHRRATAPLVASLSHAPRSVAIVGGGLFPRSLLVLSELLPEARFVVIDRSPANVETATRHLSKLGFPLHRVEFRVESFDPERHASCDLVVAPLAFVGADSVLQRAAARTLVLRHDWIWKRRTGSSRIVSWVLAKRVTLEGRTR